VRVKKGRMGMTEEDRFIYMDQRRAKIIWSLTVCRAVDVKSKAILNDSHSLTNYCGLSNNEDIGNEEAYRDSIPLRIEVKIML
jgi:hypothetical protein